MNSKKFSWAHILTTLAGVAVTAFTPAVRDLLGAHPLISSALVGVWSVLGVFLQQPHAE